MNIFMQGMRRSGTTIIFDLLWQDGSLDCYYEPLAKAIDHAKGGGSGATGIDYFEKVRETRRSYMQKDPSVESFETLNYGAPRDASLEFETTPPPYIEGYIRHMARQSEDTLIKFTRMYNKIHVLHKTDPEAVFIQIVRDPRAMAASYLFGKNRRNLHRYGEPEKFFTIRSEYSAWSSYAFSELLLNTEEFSHIKEPEDFMRILIIWQHTFRNTYNTATQLFGDRFFLLRHEDLLNSPAETLRRLYSHINRPVPGNVSRWAEQNLRRPSPPYMHDDDKWLKAFRTIGMLPELKQAGYTDCLRKPAFSLGSIFSGLLGR